LNELLDTTPGRVWERNESFGEFEQHSIVSKGGDHRLEPGVVSGSERPAAASIAGALRSARSGAVLQFGGSLPGLLDHGHDLGAQGRIQPSAHFVGREQDRLTDAQQDYNRLQAGLRALVEQSIAHLANAWALRRWRRLLYRVRDVFRAAGALVCLSRWLHRIPT
jgi:hypothetical protein